MSRRSSKRLVGEPIEKHRVYGRADWEGWAIVFETDPTPNSPVTHSGRRWKFGHDLPVLLVAYVGYHLRLWRPRFLAGEQVLRVGITYVERDQL